MGRNSGRIVKTAGGNYGIAYNRDKPVNNKLVVRIFDVPAGIEPDTIELYKYPVLSTPMLVNHNTVEFIGYVD